MKEEGIRVKIITPDLVSSIEAIFKIDVGGIFTVFDHPGKTFGMRFDSEEFQQKIGYLNNRRQPTDGYTHGQLGKFILDKYGQTGLDLMDTLNDWQ